MVITSKNTGIPVSKIMGIGDRYGAFCINEVAEYVYHKMLEVEKNQKEMSNLMKHSVRKNK